MNKKFSFKFNQCFEFVANKGENSNSCYFKFTTNYDEINVKISNGKLFDYKLFENYLEKLKELIKEANELTKKYKFDNQSDIIEENLYIGELCINTKFIFNKSFKNYVYVKQILSHKNGDFSINFSNFSFSEENVQKFIQEYKTFLNQ